MSTMTDEFASYLRACYGESKLSPLQYSEMRQAFFAGALSGVTKSVEIPSMGGTEQEGVQRLRELIDDIRTNGRPPNAKAN